MNAAAIIVNYNGGTDLIECISSLQEQTVRVEIVVVDNGSKDGSLEAARHRFPDLTYVRPEKNLGYAGGANAGARKTSAEVLLFMNPDMVLESDAVEALAEGLRSGPGVLGLVLEVEGSGAVEYGAVADWFCYPRALLEPKPPLYVPGCALATTRSVFEELGGFDERYFMFVEDLDYCWRVLLTGREVGIAPSSGGRHRGGGATPGGYGKRGEKKETTFVRVALRERNSLATIIKCAPRSRLYFLVPAFVLQMLGTALVGLLFGQPRVAIQIIRGLGWNIQDLPETLRRRKKIARTRTGEAMASGRMDRGSNKLRIIRRRGLPKFVSPRQ